MDNAQDKLADIADKLAARAIKDMRLQLAKSIWGRDWGPPAPDYPAIKPVRFSRLRKAYWRVKVALGILLRGFQENPCPYCDHDNEYEGW